MLSALCSQPGRSLSEDVTGALLSQCRTWRPWFLQDTKKYERAKELLQKDKEIKAAKKVSTGHSSVPNTKDRTGHIRSYCCCRLGFSAAVGQQ